MKILIVNKFLYLNGGSETYILEIGKCLQKMGHDVQYFGMEHEGRIVGNHAEIYTGDVEFHGSNSTGVKGKLRKLKKLTYPIKIIYSKEAYRKITAVIEDFEPDVVHLNNINFQLTPSIIEAVADYNIRNSSSIKIVYTAHDSQWVCPGHLLRVPSTGTRCFECEGGRYLNCVKNKCIHNSALRSILGAFEAYFYEGRGTYGLVDTIICPSEFMRETLETNPEIKGKCVVLHNFIPDEGRVESNNNEKMVSQLVNDKYVLYFGRFSEEKGIVTLLKVCKGLPDIRFVFAGSGPLQPEVDAVDNIEDVGFKSGKELHDLIANAYFVVFPSECHENCSFTVMESISYGTPIIASATGGTPELVRDGVDGELYEAGNVDELTSKIKKLWETEDIISRYEQGCQSVHFDTVDEYCEKLLEVYDEK